MKFNISNAATKLNTAVGIAAGITIGVAVTLTAAVHIKRCIKDLLPSKKRKVEIHVFECHDDEGDKAPEDSESEANKTKTDDKPHLADWDDPLKELATKSKK